MHFISSRIEFITSKLQIFTSRLYAFGLYIDLHSLKALLQNQPLAKLDVYTLALYLFISCLHQGLTSAQFGIAGCGFANRISGKESKRHRIAWSKTRMLCVIF